MVVTGDRELGFHFIEGAGEVAATFKEGSRHPRGIWSQG
jgi:hypothetical protein